MLAIEEDRDETVKVLVEHGVNLELANKGHIYIFIGFLIACDLGLVGIARLLLDKGVDFESRDPDGTSALSRACDGGYDSVVELLLKHGADVKSQIAVGTTPLTCAAAAWDGGRAGPELARPPSHWVHIGMNPGARRVITLLLEHGADIEHKDVDGRTPLSHATDSLKGPEFVTLLLRRAPMCTRQISVV